MANQEHLDILKQGVDAWNKWRQEHRDVEADLSEVDLQGISMERAVLRDVNLENAILEYKNLKYTDLSGARLKKAYFRLASLESADLSNTDMREATFDSAHLNSATIRSANLQFASLKDADLTGVDLSDADLSHADLSHTNLSDANLSRANLDGANLFGAALLRTNLTRANLTNCLIYGISAWDVLLEDTNQHNLVITLPDQPTITIDNLIVAQFIYLLLNRQQIRDVINTIASKVVLILGQFTPERKRALDAVRSELRRMNYTPVLFDFEKPDSRYMSDTVSTLAHVSRFIIADITDSASVTRVMDKIVPNIVVPVLTILQDPEHKPTMLQRFMTYPWVLPVYTYDGIEDLVASLQENVITPTEALLKKLRDIRKEKADT